MQRSSRTVFMPCPSLRPRPTCIILRRIASMERLTMEGSPRRRLAPDRVLARAVLPPRPGEPLSRKRWLLSLTRGHGPGKRQVPKLCVYPWSDELTIQVLLQPKKTHAAQEQYVCVTCGRTDSPEWRKVCDLCPCSHNTCSDNFVPFRSSGLHSRYRIPRSSPSSFVLLCDPTFKTDPQSVSPPRPSRPRRLLICNPGWTDIGAPGSKDPLQCVRPALGQTQHQAQDRRIWCSNRGWRRVDVLCGSGGTQEAGMARQRTARVGRRG